VQTIIETPSYLAAAKQAGMSEAEMRRVVDLLAANPDLGNYGLPSQVKAKVEDTGASPSFWVRNAQFSC
jgi:hypothetical protein